MNSMIHEMTRYKRLPFFTNKGWLLIGAFVFGVVIGVAGACWCADVVHDANQLQEIHRVEVVG